MFQHAPARAVLAARIHALKNQEHGLTGVGIEQRLQLANATRALVGFGFGLVLLQATGIAGIEICEANLSVDNDGLLFHFFD